MSSPHLPQEILFEIFSRLPAKFVGKCRCLSKSWRTLLSTPEFTKTHLNISRTREESLILVSPSHSIHVINTIQNNATSRELYLPPSCAEVDVVGSCDGLVLVSTEAYDLFLINPITVHHVNVPKSPLALIKPGSFSMYGFGHDSFHDDHKVVTLSYYDTDNEYEPDCADTFVDVYSIKRRVWKRVESSPYDHAVPELAPGAFLNRSIHWLASSRESGYRSVIATFDLTDELFSEIPAPNGVDESKFVFYKLVVLGGCLCMVDSVSSIETHVWLMKEYGLGESWTRFSIADDNDWDIHKPLCFIGDDEVVLGTEEERLLVYNLEEGRCRDMVVDGAPAVFIDGITFVGSLVSPDLCDM